MNEVEHFHLFKGRYISRELFLSFAYFPTKLLLVILLICRTVHKEMSPLPVIGVANIFSVQYLSFDIVGFAPKKFFIFM